MIRLSPACCIPEYTFQLCGEHDGCPRLASCNESNEMGIDKSCLLRVETVTTGLQTSSDPTSRSDAVMLSKDLGGRMSLY